jgi:uncharacterized membrane protein
LRCTKNELAAMEAFVELHYIKSEPLDPEEVTASQVFMMPYTTPLDAGYIPAEVERIPPGELAVRRGTQMEASDGHIGKVGELAVEPDGGHVTHLILLRGHLWGKKEIAVPISAIDRVDEDTVYLKLDKHAVGLLPALPVRRHYGRDIASDQRVELFVRIFEGADTASQLLEELRMMHLRGSIDIRSAAVLVKDDAGQVSLSERGDLDARQGALFGAITGGLVGLLGGPVGAVVGAAAGAATGRAAAKRIDLGLSDEFLGGLQERLQPGNSALVALVEHEWAKPFTDALVNVEGVILHETLAEEIVAEFLGETDEDAD